MIERALAPASGDQHPAVFLDAGGSPVAVPGELIDVPRAIVHHANVLYPIELTDLVIEVSEDPVAASWSPSFAVAAASDSALSTG